MPPAASATFTAVHRWEHLEPKAVTAAGNVVGVFPVRMMVVGMMMLCVCVCVRLCMCVCMRVFMCV